MIISQCFLTRAKTGDEGTPGILQTPTQSFFTGELPWKNNQDGISCVPDGRYICKLEKTEKHPDGIYVLQDVLNRTQCEIHSGNYFGDTSKGYRSDVLGCVILGTGRDAFQVLELTQEVVTGSRDALAKFMEEMGGNDFQLIITCADGVGPFTAA